MVKRKIYNEITWVSLENPLNQELTAIFDEFNVPESVRQEVVQETERSRMDYFKNGVYLSLHFPAVKYDTDTVDSEFDFILFDKVLITVTHTPIKSLRTFDYFFEEKIIKGRVDIGDLAFNVFYFFMRQEYQNIINHIEDISKSARDIEKQVYQDINKKKLETLTTLTHSVSDFRRALYLHKDVLESFLGVCVSRWSNISTRRIRRLQADINEVLINLENNKEFLSDLKEAGDTLLNLKTSETIKKLTVINFMFLPLALVAGIFGMNTTSNLLILNSLERFVGLIGFMVIVSFCIYIYIKSKRWL